MSSRKITIITSPQAGILPLPASMSAASTPTKATSVYRIEERSRTIYVAGDVDPAQWDTHSLNAIFALAEVPEDAEGQDQPIRRAYSCEDGPQLIITPESSQRSSDDSTSGSPRYNPFHSRRLGRGAHTASARMSTMSPYNFQQPLPPPPSLPKRILFYHKHNPHYGFTNFSSHPVVYKGKRYPTSEHLFQSFKVHTSFLFLNGLLIIFVSSSSIDQT
jgi:diaminohydroxyphosphoribosylaminopyrimidine deaminase/5-amino-6-(5-phosphoribosylamino)uracil reductase